MRLWRSRGRRSDRVGRRPVCAGIGGWPLFRKHQYFDWAKAIVDQVPPSNPRLAEKFDAAYALRSKL